ncbi:unnamed protein product [Dicrocoelium dendriticum]|nr:unnamed protein product [Dicrocoelium dendriticum]
MNEPNQTRFDVRVDKRTQQLLYYECEVLLMSQTFVKKSEEFNNHRADSLFGKSFKKRPIRCTARLLIDRIMFERKNKLGPKPFRKMITYREIKYFFSSKENPEFFMFCLLDEKTQRRSYEIFHCEELVNVHTICAFVYNAVEDPQFIVREQPSFHDTSLFVDSLEAGNPNVSSDRTESPFTERQNLKVLKRTESVRSRSSGGGLFRRDTKSGNENTRELSNRGSTSSEHEENEHKYRKPRVQSSNDRNVSFKIHSNRRANEKSVDVYRFYDNQVGSPDTNYILKHTSGGHCDMSNQTTATSPVLRSRSTDNRSKKEDSKRRDVDRQIGRRTSSCDASGQFNYRVQSHYHPPKPWKMNPWNTNGIIRLPSDIAGSSNVVASRRKPTESERYLTYATSSNLYHSGYAKSEINGQHRLGSSVSSLTSF